ncbi:glycine betaine/proline transport system substrate-binding protein [Maridesulfovibrio ferrireducens]|uniref:Glycine betaine/proline transport system substrate-binding protein n=1 Tax=Maridesulfovibrio ferrireducens TaxID=246191 RepID=A0A1G9AXZ6_9BACT|nr:glycine betaine ABC transporter substrate-binding protein [Maridesulfovibrio ferrireducens]SDK32068.1 glycine betaine/proline transport system substrate-binding protein [Maridesulfovibrio ferrireducens]
MKKILTLLMAALLIASLSATAFAGDKKVKLAYVEWDCATATTNVIQAVLQERMGYEVEILPVAAAIMWQAVGTGDVDATAAAWLPITHADYLKRVENNVVDLGPNVTGAKLGWAVPSYVTVDSIADLNQYADKLDDRIIGIDPGAGIMTLSEKAIEEYKLKDLELMEGSGATMTASLSNAIKNKEWIVVTAWSPHWLFGRWDMKFLKDPKGILGGEETINTVVRKGLKEDKPEVYAFLDKFAWKDAKQFQMVMAWNQEEGADPYENAKRFIKENKEQVDSWLK